MRPDRRHRTGPRPATKEPYPWDEKRGLRVCDFARAEACCSARLGNVIVIMPPLAITLDELDRICRAVERGIAVGNCQD